MEDIKIDYKSKKYFIGAEFYNKYNVRIQIIGKSKKDKLSKKYYCKFDDGKIHLIDVTSIKNGNFSYPIIFSQGNNSNNIYKTIYKRFEFMLSRCNNPKSKDYERYGGRGIKCLFNNIYEFWFELQKDNNLPLLLKNPDIYEIDRIDNNGNYEIGNIRVVTKSENQRNRRDNHLYNLIYNDTNEICFTGIKKDCETWIFNNLSVKTSLCNIYIKKRIGKSSGRSIRYEKIITGIE